MNCRGIICVGADLLVKLEEDEHILVVTMHHIASDGWSKSILVKEVIALYKAYSENVEALLPELPVQYADYSVWQQKYLHGEILENKIAYWKSKLDGVATLQLPADYSRPLIQSSRGATRSFNISRVLSAQLAGLSHNQGTTLYMTLLAAFKVLLHRYSGQEDICVGTPVAGRDQQELEGLIGVFINTLVLRSQVKGDMTFIELLQEVKETTLDAYGHQEVPFEKVVDAVVKERDMSRNPLFQVMFALQNTPDAPELELGGLVLSTEGRERTTAQFDIAFMIRETNTGIQGTVEYATDLYREETIERMISHYSKLLASIVTSADQLVDHLGMLSSAEEETLLSDFNATGSDYPKDKTVITLFEEQVIRYPEAIAVVFEGLGLSYSELNKRSNQLAHYLQSQGVKTGTLMPICVERGLDMMIGILGILKAGGAYVPVDPDYPADRINYMLEDTGAELVLSSIRSRDKLSGVSRIIELDGDWHLISNQPEINIAPKAAPGDLAHV